MMNDSSFSFINCYYINFCWWSVLKTLLMHIMKDSQCVVAAKSDKNHYHLAWPWHKKAKFTDFLPLQILCHLFLKIYLFILGGGCIWVHTGLWVKYSTGLQRLWLTHSSFSGSHLTTATSKGSGAVREEHWENDGGISGFQPCCQSRYEQPFLGRVCVKLNSTTSLKASGSPAGLRSVLVSQLISPPSHFSLTISPLFFLCRCNH